MSVEQYKAQITEIKEMMRGPLSPEMFKQYQQQIDLLESKIKAEQPPTPLPPAPTVAPTVSKTPAPRVQQSATPAPKFDPTQIKRGTFSDVDKYDQPLHQSMAENSTLNQIKRGTFSDVDKYDPPLHQSMAENSTLKAQENYVGPPPSPAKETPKASTTPFDMPNNKQEVYIPPQSRSQTPLPGTKSDVPPTPPGLDNVKPAAQVTSKFPEIVEAKPAPADEQKVDSTDVPDTPEPLKEELPEGELPEEELPEEELPEEELPEEELPEEELSGDSVGTDNIFGDASGKDLNVSQQVTSSSTESPVDDELLDSSIDTMETYERQKLDQEDARFIHQELSSLAQMTEEQKNIVATREEEGKRLLEEYQANMDQVERLEFVDKLSQAFGTMLAGIVGMVTDLPVSQYFQAMDMYDPTSSKERFDSVYRVAVAQADKTEAEKLAQLKGAWDAVNSSEPAEKQTALLDAIKKAFNQSIQKSQNVSNKPDELSQSTSTANAEAFKEYQAAVKAAQEERAQIEKDPTYLAAKANKNKIDQMLAEDAVSGNYSTDRKDIEESEKKRAAFTENNKTLVSDLINVDKVLGTAEGSQWSKNSGLMGLWGNTGKERAQGTKAFDVDANKNLVMTEEAKAMMKTFLDPAVNRMASMHKGASVPSAENLMRYASEVITKDPRAADLSVEDTMKLALADYHSMLTGGGGLPGRLGLPVSKLSNMDLADKYFGIGAQSNGFNTLSGLQNVRKTQEDLLNEYEGRKRQINTQISRLHQSYTRDRNGDSNYELPILDAREEWAEPKTAVFERGNGSSVSFTGLKLRELPRVSQNPQTGSVELPPAWEDEEVKQLVDGISKKHGISKSDFFGLMAIETGYTFDPRIVNEIGATGIIQFVPSTAAEQLNMLNYKGKKNWSPAEAQDAMAKMNLVNQLKVTDNYLNTRARGTQGIDNIYTSIFAGNPGHSKIVEGQAGYAGNRPLDKNNDGVISRDEWMVNVLKAVKRFNNVQGYEGAQ